MDDAAAIANVSTAPGPAGRGGGGNAPAAHAPAYSLKISALSDDTFTITNTRNQFSKTYRK